MKLRRLRGRSARAGAGPPCPGRGAAGVRRHARPGAPGNVLEPPAGPAAAEGGEGGEGEWRAGRRGAELPRGAGAGKVSFFCLEFPRAG